MGAGSIWHWIILLLIVVLLFGRGKISEIMGDVAKGIKSFKKGMSDDETEAKSPDAPKTIDHVSGSTEQASRLGDRRWRELLERHHALVRRQLERYQGRELDTAGDGFFATFDGPARAVRCAIAIVDAVRRLGIEIRAGVHTGEVETIDGDVGGMGVVIGARVGASAGASEVLVSQTVKDLVAGSGLVFQDAGEHELKGVPDRWRLYRVAT